MAQVTVAAIGDALPNSPAYLAWPTCGDGPPTVTSGRRVSSVFGPIPDTRRKSSTEVKGFVVRAC
jgi:hypothetical protein